VILNLHPYPTISMWQPTCANSWCAVGKPGDATVSIYRQQAPSSEL